MNFARTVFAISIVCPMWAQNTVALSGRITDLATGQPVEEAAVTLTQGGGTHTSFTDASGNYSFDEAVAGAGEIAIRADGFAAFEKTNPDDVSIQIAADHGQHDFKLTPAASISGRISREDAGGPATSLVATLLQEVFTDGVRRFSAGGEEAGSPNAGVSQVEADGSFKFTGLAPGRYIVSAGPPAGPFMAIRLFGSASKEHPAEAWVQTFYPGTTDFAATIPISLGIGETRIADFKMTKTRLFRASGEIDSEDIGGGKGTVLVLATGGGPLQRAYSGAAAAPGAFAVEGLPPGQYAATSLTIPGESIPTDRGVSFSFRMIQVNLAFAVTDHDVEGLKLVPAPHARQLEVTGSFRMASDGAKLPTGLSVQYSDPQPGGQSDAIPAADNGEFWLSGPPGDYSVRPRVPPGYAVTEIRYGGANYLNSLIPMRGDTLDSSITVVLSDQPGSVSGSVVDGEGKPVAAKIVLAPEPLPAGFDFRAFRVVSDDDKGGFVFSGIAPGRYKAVALTGDDRRQDHDLAILGDKLRAADAFEVVAGQGLSIAPRP